MITKVIIIVSIQLCPNVLKYLSIGGKMLIVSICQSTTSNLCSNNFGIPQDLLETEANEFDGAPNMHGEKSDVFYPISEI